MSGNKDIFGDDMDQEALDAFEGGDESDPQKPGPQTAEPQDDDFEEVVEQLEKGGEIELDPERPVSIHKQKKQNRWQQHTQRADDAERARQEAERRAELAERELQVLRQTAQQPQQYQQQADDSAEENEIYEQQARLYDLYNRKAESGAVTPEETAQFKRDARALQNKLMDTRIAKMMQQQPQQDVGQAALQAQLRMQYPDVYGDPRARTYALGVFQTMIAEGEPNSVETVKKALNKSAKRFKLASATSDVDESTKRRYTGPMRGSTAKTSASPKIVITKDILKIANATYPNIDDEKERLKMWIKVHGKDYAENIKNEQS